jgi:hypothetical protein
MTKIIGLDTFKKPRVKLLGLATTIDPIVGCGNKGLVLPVPNMGLTVAKPSSFEAGFG